ncbi:hypothetical protein MBLNU459_g7302t1 [Dothideomycetes sp. NU459]
MSDHLNPKANLHPSRIEKALALRILAEESPSAFINTSSPWAPPWGRGIFGGVAIAQSLVAAQADIPSSFSVHSMHCYFISAANNRDPLVYTVQRLRDGQAFATRTVHVSQHGTLVCTATISFTREGRAKKVLRHSAPMASDVPPPPAQISDTGILTKAGHTGDDRPCDFVRCPIIRSDRPDTQKTRHWMRARGNISDSSLVTGAKNGQELAVEMPATESRQRHQTHVAALAYMTDTYFLGTVYRAHRGSRFANKRIADRALATYQGCDSGKAETQRFFELAAQEELNEDPESTDSDLQIDMMASLDHTIYFHSPRTFRADEWMLGEIETPWAGNERGLVVQRIWSTGGMLIATCVQEGVVRLFQDVEKSHM